MYIIKGNFPNLKNRQLDNILASYQKKGYHIEYITEGYDIDNPFLPDLCFFVGYDFKEPELYSSYSDIVIYYNDDPKGNTKAGKFLKGLKKDVFDFTFPDQPWELKKAVESFLESELKRMGLSFSNSQIKTSFLERINYDPGVLLFELDKFKRITSIIEAQHIKDLTPDFFDQGLDSLIDAIGAKSKKMIAHYLHRMNKNSKNDPTMMICKVLQPQICKWLSVLDYMDLDKASEQLKLNPWLVKNKLSPVAKALGFDLLLNMLRVVNEAEQGILSGYSHINLSFQARFLALF
jgi:DNA polymerase III delta subunit